MTEVATRWSVDQVLTLVPDASSERAARTTVAARRWQAAGTDEGELVWGCYSGSGATAYQAIADLSGPAFRCSCPSRKVPCKHVLGLLLRWADGTVGPGDPPDWVLDWTAARTQRAGRPPREPAEPNPATVARRAERIAAGLEELNRWLDDQVRAGVAGLTTAGYGPFDTLAARLIDAQAPGAARLVRRLAGTAVSGSVERLVTELGLLRLLIRGYRRLDQLPPGLAATVRSRVGLPVSTADVLAGPRVQDRWAVVGARDEGDEQLTTRRVWLRGCDTGRPALVLSFAAGGQALPAELVVGTTVEAELCFYPGAGPLRALVAGRGDVGDEAPTADRIGTALQGHAGALAGDPWLDRWPMLEMIDLPARGHDDTVQTVIERLQISVRCEEPHFRAHTAWWAHTFNDLEPCDGRSRDRPCPVPPRRPRMSLASVKARHAVAPSPATKWSHAPGRNPLRTVP